MGYQTEFVGAFAVMPPLTADEVAFLRRFAETRHGDGLPSRWCHWEATGEGNVIRWNGGPQFYEPEKWIAYLISHFLLPGHVVNGAVDARGEEAGDVWRLVVTDNVVTVRANGWEYGPITEATPDRTPGIYQNPECWPDDQVSPLDENRSAG
ncbi:hypothetical protein [Catenulispora sp. GP43]|uniref:hypothetical protein n=1 Tax=Catenulispora sp. GP43 TaxID=3156263 RepID=UPI003518C516